MLVCPPINPSSNLGPENVQCEPGSSKQTFQPKTQINPLTSIGSTDIADFSEKAQH